MLQTQGRTLLLQHIYLEPLHKSSISSCPDKTLFQLNLLTILGKINHSEAEKKNLLMWHN